MKNIQLVHLAKYNDSERYRLIEEGIYIDLKDADETHYRIALSFEQEEGEDDQYPLENLLDEFNLYVSADFPESNNQVLLELGGTLKGIQKMKSILEKHVLNKITHKPPNAVVPEYKKFKEIGHLLSIDSLAREWNEDNSINDEICLYIPGDWEVENLDLDEVYDNIGNYVYLILVSGNMKAKNIYCTEIDGGPAGLTVLGSLEAENIIVAGQEIYVCGSLTVKDCFWGDYNHGNLEVGGTITVNVFIATDYGYDFERFDEKDGVYINYFFSDEDEEGNYEFPRWRISGIFKEYCLVAEFDIVDDIDGWGDWLYKYKMIEYLRAGNSILLENIKIQEPAVVEIPFAFESKAFNNANLLRLRESPLFLDHYLPDAKERFQKIEYWKGDDFKRVLVTKEELFSEKVYFQQEDRALLMEYVEVKTNIFKKLLGNTPRYQISISCRTTKGDDDDNWEVYNSLLQEHKKYLSLTQDFWEDLLTEWSEMEHYYLQFQKTVTVEKIKHILSLPVVKAKYSDYYNEDGEPLWFRSFNWQFRLIDNEEKQCERITIIHDLSTEEEDEYDFYHYDLKKLDNGATAVVFYTQDEDGYECSSYEVAVSDSIKFKNAVEYFEVLEGKIERINEEYLKALQIREEYIAQIPTTVPFETINYRGYDFKLISFHEAHDLVKDLKDLEEEEYLYDVFDSYFFPIDISIGGYFLLAEEDVVLSQVELDMEVFHLQDNASNLFSIYIYGFIFLKNVTVTSLITTISENFPPPALIIKGKLECTNLHLSGSINYIGGFVSCKFLFAENLGALFVQGKLTADCIVADMMQCYFGEIVAMAIISKKCIYSYDNILDGDGNIHKQMNFYPDTHFLEDVLKAEIIYSTASGSRWTIISEILDNFITEGKSPIDYNKDFHYQTLTDTNIAPRFKAIFNHELLRNGNYMLTDDEMNHTFMFTCFEWNGKSYREISCSEEEVFGYKARILHDIEENSYSAHLDYFDKERNKVALRFSSSLSDTFTSTKAAKHGFCLAEMALKSEIKIAEINNSSNKDAFDIHKRNDFLDEALILMTLPSEYKNFIEKYNEASFTPFKFEIQGGKIKSIVMKFFTLKGDNEILLFNKIKEFTTSGILPQSLIPIAIDPIKNLILLAVTGVHSGKVYYWAIDEEDYEDTLTPRHLHLVANRFNDFIG